MVPSGAYTFQIINDPSGTTGIQGGGINSRGDVVGRFSDDNYAVHGFLRSPAGNYTNFDAPNGVGNTFANGINDRGQIVGSFGDLSDLGFHGFLRSRDGEYTNFDDPNGVGSTFANGINNQGKIVGYYVVYSSQGFGTQHGFLRSDGQYTNIDYPNAVGSGAQGMNDRGQIVGFYVINPNSQFGEHGFLLSGGQYTTLDDPNAVLGAIATGINDRGQIVGYYFDANDFAHGFLLSDGQYTTVDVPNSPDTLPFGINDSGKISGQSDFGVFLATPQDGGVAHGDPGLKGSSLVASQANGGNPNVFLADADLTDATLTSNQEIYVAGGSGANRSDDWSRISTGPTATDAKAPSTLHGSGDQVVSAAAAGKHSARTGNDAFAHIDAVFSDNLFSQPA
jgi:probable HAF family extracellular repeat protein